MLENKEAVGSSLHYSEVLPIAGQKYLQIFRAKFDILHGVSECLCIYTTISRGTPNDVLRKQGWEALL
jgi:hypothetical protein